MLTRANEERKNAKDQDTETIPKPKETKDAEEATQHDKSEWGATMSTSRRSCRKRLRPFKRQGQGDVTRTKGHCRTIEL